MTVKQALTDVKFYLVFFALCIGSGTGVSVFHNMGMIVESMGAAPGSQSAYVSVLGASSCLGRLGVGWLSGKLEGRVNRPWLFFASLVMQSLGQFIMAFSNLSVLYLGCGMCAMAVGAGFSVISTILADIFGSKRLGTIMSFIFLSSPLGGTLFSRLLVTSLYKAQTPQGSTTCMGRQCFHAAFLINGGNAAAGAIFALILCFKSKSVYERKLARRLSSRQMMQAPPLEKLDSIR